MQKHKNSLFQTKSTFRMMVHILIPILFLMNVMGSKIDEQNEELESVGAQLEVAAKLQHVHINDNKKMYRNLNEKCNPLRYVPVKIRENVLTEGLAGFEQKYDMIKTRNYYRFFIERLSKFLLRKFHYVDSALLVIYTIETYLFSSRSIVADENTPDDSKISELITSEVNLLAYKPTNYDPAMVFPALPGSVSQSLKWYFLDLSGIGNTGILKFKYPDLTLFCKYYLLFGPHTTSLHFYKIKWNFIKFLRVTQETISKINFEELNDSLYLNAEQHHLPKFIKDFFVDLTSIKYMNFREGTIIDRFTIRVSNDQEIQWNNIVLPHIKTLKFFSYPAYLYQGNGLEHTQNSERVEELDFGFLDIQQLDLSRFTNVKVVRFCNCNFSNPKSISIPEHASVEIDINTNFFYSNFTYLKLHFVCSDTISPAILQYPNSLIILELAFSDVQRSYKIINWYENLRAANVPHLHTFILHFYGVMHLDPLLELKNQLEMGNLELKDFSTLRELHIINGSTRILREYDFHTFINDVKHKLPKSVQEIRYTFRDWEAVGLLCPTQIWRQDKYFNEVRANPETFNEIRDRFYQKKY